MDSEIAEHNGLLLLREDMKTLQSASPEHELCPSASLLSMSTCWPIDSKSIS